MLLKAVLPLQASLTKWRFSINRGQAQEGLLVAERSIQQLGDYRLLHLLGRGRFADVYLGERIHLKRQVAIKLLHPQVTPSQQEDFLQEAQHLANLGHPHIIRVLHFAIERGIPYLVMEYAPSGTLRTRHPLRSQLPGETIVAYIKHIADALHYLHEQKLVHRDIKPENMLLGVNQEILLSDFGLAAVAHTTSSLSLEGRAGTPLYMAPEQIQGRPRPASDQYALGVMAYEWLCGDGPFHGSFMEFATQHLYASPPSLQERLPTISPAIERVVFTALAKDPKRRFPSVREFAAALEQAMQLPGQSESPSNAQFYISKGEALLKTAKYKEALALYEHAIQLESSNAQFYMHKGNVLFKMEKYTEALAAFEQAIQLEPTNAQFHRNKAKAALSLERFEDALESYENAIRKEALTLYEHAIQLESSNAQFYVHKGNMLFKMEKHAEALAAFEQAIQLEPTNAQFHRNKAKAALSLDCFEDALESYENAIRQESNNPYLYKERGDILFRIKRFEEAIIYYEHAINLYPGFGLAHLNKGKAFEQLAQQAYERFHKQAQQAFEKAKELGTP